MVGLWCLEVGDGWSWLVEGWRVWVERLEVGRLLGAGIWGRGGACTIAKNKGAHLAAAPRSLGAALTRERRSISSCSTRRSTCRGGAGEDGNG